MAKPDAGIERPLPQNIDAERAVLGAVLLDNSTIHIIGEMIEPRDFFHDHHRRIYLAMLEMHEDGIPVDLVALCEFLSRKKQLEAAGGAAYLSTLMDACPHTPNAGHYAKIVRQKSVLRQLIHATQAIQQQALEAEDDAPAILARAEKMMCQVLESQTREPVARLGAAGNGHVDFKSYSFSDFMTATFPPKDHLIEAMTPKMGRVMIIAMPHRLKSWATIGLALHGSRAGTALGMLRVNEPVRTYVAQLEDWPGMLQTRFNELVMKPEFSGADVRNLHILPRCSLDLTIDSHFAWLLQDLKKFSPDHVVLDVLRKFFGGDVNSPKDTAVFLKRLDYLQDEVGCALTLVHHENRKREDIMMAAAGSYNWAGWAEVLILFSRKIEAKTDTGTITSVEIEIDTKVGPPVESMRLVLDTSSANPLRLEALEDGSGFHDSMKQLSAEAWNVDHLAAVLGVGRASAWKRLEKWEKSGKVEKIKSGKRGRGGGLAIWRSLDPIDTL